MMNGRILTLVLILPILFGPSIFSSFSNRNPETAIEPEEGIISINDPDFSLKRGEREPFIIIHG